jgi:DNA ligase-1
MKFITVATYFECIEKTSSRLEMTKLLAELLHEATPSEASIICNLSLGQLNPPYIGTQFNIAEKNIIKMLAHFLQLSESTVKEHARKLGDLGSVVEAYEWPVQDEPTVHQVYDALHVLEAVSGTGSHDEKGKQLSVLIEKLDPLSAKYVLRIILGKLRLGFSDMTIVDALSWLEAGDKSLRDTIEDAYNVCADIGFIASMLKEQGIKEVASTKIRLGIPIRPSAAERSPSAAAIFKKLGPCVAQPKLDGFRLQIHLDKSTQRPKIKFFSRNLQDMSEMFPELTQEVKDIDVETMICEGEAIAYDQNTGNFLPFQETVKRKRKHGIEAMQEELPLYIFLFDLLYLNGKDLLSEPHETRRKKLLHLFKKVENPVIKVIEEIEIATTKELEHYFAANIASGLEGLVVKRPDGIYQPGKRNFNWIKLKRQEEGHLEDTVDCVILGYYAGEGKRSDFGVGAFLVGVYNKQEDRFETVAKIGTGLKDKDLIELKKKCDALSVVTQPKNVQVAKNLYPEVWVSPEIVVSIRADEITMSPVHSAGKTDEKLGYALRFPRFMGYRIDKGPEETTTITELEGLYKDQFKKS